MPSPAIYDFFRQIRIIAPDLVTVEATLEADSTTDILTINPSSGVKFTGTENTDTFSIDVDYSIYVPLGTTALTLQDVNSNTSSINVNSGPGITVLRNSNNEIEIGLDEGYTAIKRFAVGADDSTLRFLDDGESMLILGGTNISTASDAEGNITITGPSALSSFSNDTNFITLTDLSVGTEGTASGDGDVSYNNTTGVFTYTPPDLSSYLTSVNGTVTGSLIPDTDVTYDLGSATNKFRDLYLSGASINLGSAVITASGTAITLPANSTISGTSISTFDGAFGSLTGTPTTLAGYGITDAATSAQGALADSAVQPSDNISTLTNDSGFITDYTVTQADVTQHQAALSITESQISDLQSYLTSETTTTLTSDSVNQRLQYTDETGTVNNIDLSWAVDDTNLARLTSGSLDGGTGIATFTRDDATSFTVDFSPLFDDTNLTRITSAGFNTSNGVLTLTRSDATTVTVDLDGRYLDSFTETNDLTSAVTWANVPDANITQSSVTQHQAALSITESQISDLGSYIVLGDLSVTSNAASGNGTLTYSNTTGVFTYTPPDLSSFITSADGGDAATLDSLDSTQFLRSDAADEKTSGNLTLNDNVRLLLGTSGGESELYSDGTNTYWELNADKDLYITDDGTNRFLFDGSVGDFHADGDVIAFSTSVSDERLKDDIAPVENAVDKIKRLDGVTFTRKHNGEKSAGVIAQQLEKILPEAVKEKALPLITGSEDELYKTVEYDALHAILIEAVKELTKRIEDLENK